MLKYETNVRDDGACGTRKHCSRDVFSKTWYCVSHLIASEGSDNQEHGYASTFSHLEMGHAPYPTLADAHHATINEQAGRTL